MRFRQATISAAVLLLALAGAASAGLYQGVILADNPEGYWRLGDSAATAVDATGNGHAGTYLNGVAQGQAGALVGDPDGAAGFNGSNHKVDIPYSADLNPVSFSFECWAKVAPGTDGGHRSPMTSRANSPQSGYIFYAQGGRWQFWTGPGWQTVFAPTGSVVQDEWAHLVGTYDATTQEKKLYINGQLAGMATGVTVTPNPSAPLRIGAGATEGGGAYFFRGDIDEAAVYDTALSNVQIRRHYNAAHATEAILRDFANPGGVGLGADASGLVLAGRTGASPTLSNPDGTLVLGGGGTGGAVYTGGLPGILFTEPLVIETEACYVNGDAPDSQSNAYMGLKALHLMGTSSSGTDRKGGLWAQFQPYTTGSAHMRIGFQSAATSGGDLWYDSAAQATVSGFADANAPFTMQLLIEGLEDDDAIVFKVLQSAWSGELETTVAAYRDALPGGDIRNTFDAVLAELRADPSLMNYGFISTAARDDGYNYLDAYYYVPEPATMALVGAGLLALARRRRRA